MRPFHKIAVKKNIIYKSFVMIKNGLTEIHLQYMIQLPAMLGQSGAMTDTYSIQSKRDIHRAYSNQHYC